MFKEWGKVLLFFLLFPFLLVAIIAGFITCWQCHGTVHLFRTKKYQLRSFGSERVCKDCYRLLTKRRN